MKTKWISITDKLPEIGTPVLTCNLNGICYDEREPMIGFIDDADNLWYVPWSENKLTPTHWMELPELPEDEIEVEKSCNSLYTTPRKQAEADYAKAKTLGVTDIDRWGKGIEHHPMSVRLMLFLAEHDFVDYADYFCWKIGGDGDNGETLMYQMDAFFEMLEGETK